VTAALPASFLQSVRNKQCVMNVMSDTRLGHLATR